MIEVAVTVNGVEHRIRTDPWVTLVEFLRDTLSLTGTKEGCGAGECGSCLVLLDGEAVNSCLVLIGDADGHDVVTIEGLAGDDGPSALQSAFAAAGAVQCGYCTPGMIVAAEALLRSDPDPSPAEVRRALSGVLCRCGTYPRVVEAVRGATATDGSGP